jgi:hypothetical protein
MQTTQDFLITPLRVLTLPEMAFFHMVSQPVANLDSVLDPLLEGLYAARHLAQITAPGPDIVRYYKAPGGNLSIMEAGIAVESGTLPAGEAQMKTLPPFRCASVLLWGGLVPHIVQTYEALFQAMKDAGLESTDETREVTYYFESIDSPNNLMGIYIGLR